MPPDGCSPARRTTGRCTSSMSGPAGAVRGLSGQGRGDVAHVTGAGSSRPPGPRRRTARIFDTTSDRAPLTVALPPGHRPGRPAAGRSGGRHRVGLRGARRPPTLGGGRRTTDPGGRRRVVGTSWWSPDGRFVATGTIAGAAVWEVSSGQRLAELPGHPWIDQLAGAPTRARW